MEERSERRRRCAILLWATDPADPQRCAAPFFHAMAAAAMDAEVEVYFASGSVRLLVRGVAEALTAMPGEKTTIYDFMQRAAAQGVKFYACPQALQSHGIDPAQLVPECTGTAGATAFRARALDASWTTLSF